MVGSRRLVGVVALGSVVALLGCLDQTEESPSRTTGAEETSADASTDAEVDAGTCVRQPFTVAVSAPPVGAVAAGTTVHYDVSITDHDVGNCDPSSYSASMTQEDLSVDVVVQQGIFSSVAAGQTITVPVDVSGLPHGDPGAHELLLRIEKRSTPVPPSASQIVRLVHTLAPPAGCMVSKRAELMILSTKVVDDPVRTRGNLDHFADTGPRGAGSFSFAHFMRALAPNEAAAPALVERLLSIWLTNQEVNGFVVKARPAMRERVLDLWPRTPSGELDLERAPLRLQAIVNRVDLRDLSRHSAGEGRLVFAFDVPRFFTLILEYNMPAETEADVLAWAKAWHALSSHTFGGPAYRAALDRLVHRFTRRGADPSSPNGSALFRIRTNENELAAAGDGSAWELRQFELSPVDGFFAEAPVAETPDLTFDRTATFTDFVTENAAAIAAAIPGASTGLVPRTFRGAPFLAGSAINTIPNGVSWSGPGLGLDARFRASIMTCNGCHSIDTLSIFLQITPRQPGFEARLSGFIRGVTVRDTGRPPFELNDLARRQTDLESLVCQPAKPPTTCP